MQSSNVKSALRVFEVLEFFMDKKTEQSLQEITRSLGYPQSSTTVLLKTMVSSGYLSYERARRVYFPTAKLTALGEWVPAALFGQTRMIDALEFLHDSTHEGVTISTINDIYLQYMQILQSKHALRFTVDEGELRVLTHSVIGWTLLSSYTDDKIDNIVRRANIASEPVNRVNPAVIIERVKTIRQQGYGWVEDIPILGSGTMCILLPERVRNLPAVLSLGGAKERVFQNRERYFSALNQAAALTGNGGEGISPLRTPQPMKI